MTPLWLLLGLACAGSPERATPDVGEEEPEQEDPESGLRADVLAVEASGAEGAWTFAVTVQSPDVDCEQYAQWWEVVDPSGEVLHYRRVLAHSHASEQPFTRTGEPVPVAADQEVVVRAFMKPGGYGGQALRGTVAGGFQLAELPEGWGAALSSVEPLPESCAY